MSYRTVKRLMGETSLERKCRFLLGGGLMLLISGSFYFYARLNTTLLYEQNKTTARMLVAPIILEKHWKWAEPDEEVGRVIENMADELKPKDLKEYRWSILKADPTIAEPNERPDDDAGYDALEQLRNNKREVVDIVHSKNEFNYYGEVRAEKSCLTCHYHRDPNVAENDLIGMVKVTLPLSSMTKALAWNNAILLTTAIVTAALAMLAASAIVRYVIVKPVQHLKHVSDEIARGTLDLRADIRTGDEFEELSHAFNRMLRHLVTVQDELREVNTDLDGKVDELAQVNLQLYEMNKLKDEFLATMSHELRTPLNSILGFSDVLAGAKNLNGKQQRFVSNIQISGKNLMMLINDVLDLAKIESGKMELRIAEFSMADLIERQAGSLLPLAEKKNIDLTWQIDDDVPTLVQDPQKLQQILNNLLSNAIKFTPEGGRVRVRSGLFDRKTADLIVEDTGIGIPLEEQATIFEKFRQGRTLLGRKDPMAREYGGTGLGLSIVKELSKLIGGEVLLESEFGKGSTFTVRLPLRLDEQPKRLDEELRDRVVGLEQVPTIESPTPKSDVVAESAKEKEDAEKEAVS